MNASYRNAGFKVRVDTNYTIGVDMNKDKNLPPREGKCSLCGKPLPVVLTGGSPKVSHMACLMEATKHLRKEDHD